MKLLGISGSLRTASSNTAILRAIATLVPKEIDYSIYDGMNDLPHYSPDIDDDRSPTSVIQFRSLLKEADGIVISTPEYAYGMPGVLKNALDWTVSSGEFYKKPVVAISASPSWLGGDKARVSLLMTLTAMNSTIVDEGSFTIPFIRKKVNENGEIADRETIELLRSSLNALVKKIKTRSTP